MLTNVGVACRRRSHATLSWMSTLPDSRTLGQLDPAVAPGQGLGRCAQGDPVGQGLYREEIATPTRAKGVARWSMAPVQQANVRAAPGQSQKTSAELLLGRKFLCYSRGLR